MNNKAFFTNIRSEIISLLETASDEVLIAMAWFTNRQLLDSLIQCLRRGVRVRLILLDDIINHCDFGADFNLFIQENGSEFYLYPPSLRFMHNKFCIVDGKIVVTGSYNWTNYAETRNHENIVISSDPILVRDYTDCFSSLVTDLTKSTSFEVLTQQQVPEGVFLSRLSDFAQEVYSSPSMHASPYGDEFQKKIASAKIDVPETIEALISENGGRSESTANDSGNTHLNNAGEHKIVITEVKNFKYPVSRYNIGFKAKLRDQNGREGLKVMIEKGQALPYTITLDAESANSGDSNSMSSTCEFYYGDMTDISKCSKIGEALTLNNLPKLKEGEVKFKIIMTLEESGNLSVRFVCVNTGTGVEGKHTQESFVEYRNS